MKIIAIIYLVLAVLSYLFEPLLFGEERKPYSWQSWIFKLVFNAPLLWLLWVVATQ